MPPAIAIGASLFGTWAAGAIGLTGILGTIVGGLISMGVSSIANSLFGDKSSGGGASGVKDSGILVTDQGNQSAIPVVYGTRKIAGTRVYITTTDNNQYLEIVYALAEGPVESINAMYFNGVKVLKGPLNDQKGGKLPAGIKDTSEGGKDWSGAFTGEYRLGTDGQSAFGDLIKNTKDFDEGKWTTDHRLAGVACVYLRLKFNRDLFQGIPEVQFDVSGSRIRSVLDLNVAPRFSTNPADILYDYLTAAKPYSKGIPANLIDIQSFKAAAQYCYEKEADIGNRPRYEINGHIDTADSMFANVKRILSNFNAMLVFSGGVYKLIINKPETSTGFVFNEENIIGKIDMQLGSKEVRLNKVKANFFNPDLDWAADVYIANNTNYYNYDGKTELLREVDFAMVGDRRRVGYISQIIMNQSRYCGTVSFRAAPSALNVEVGQIVELQHEFIFGDSNSRYYRVMGLKLNTDTTVDVTLQEYNSAVYDITPVEARPTTGRVPRPSVNTSIAPVGPLVLVNKREVLKDGGVLNSLAISWTAAPTDDIRNYEVTITNTTANTSAIVTTVNTAINYTDIVDGNNYSVSVRTVNGVGARSGALT